MTAILLLACLIGPLPEASPSLKLIIHVDAKSRESQIVRSELARDHLWFSTKRYIIEQHYKIEVKEDLYNARPSYQIGKADDRHEFPPGTFSASGTFMLTLKSITDIDQFERYEPDLPVYYGDYPYFTVDRPLRPKLFPPVVTESTDP